MEKNDDLDSIGTGRDAFALCVEFVLSRLPASYARVLETAQSTDDEVAIAALTCADRPSILARDHSEKENRLTKQR